MLRNFRIFFIIGIIFFALPFFVFADSLGQQTDFFIDSLYDLSNRTQITATLRRVTSELYFYIDDEWWDQLDKNSQSEIKESIKSLGYEFGNKIYPILTDSYGKEWKSGIDKDEHVTVLIHQMKKTVGGYFNSGDEYPKTLVENSNEREMVYLNSESINSNLEKSLLAHEFTHLIIFNQKEKEHGVSEEVWLNEMRAEYAPTLVGYDLDYEGSNLQRRVKNFLSKPYDSLTEWRSKSYDYGVINLFCQYLVEHYGIEILTDSLHSEKVGIPSLNYALEKNGIEEDFSQIFTDWTIAVLVNNCDLGEKYCYLNENLNDLRIVPFVNYLPSIGRSTLSITNTTKDWAGNWHKFIGGKNVLKFEFNGYPGTEIKIPYIIEDFEGNFKIDFLELDKKQDGIIYVPDFSEKNISLTIIPSSQTKISGFNGSEPSYSFFWSATTVERTPEEEEELILQLKEQISFLKAEIEKVKAQIEEIKARLELKFEKDLYFGLKNNSDIKRLQEFLKSQESEIYPEALITGNFLSLTEKAVIRFQEKYASEILFPLGLEKGTGFVGSVTRAKINQLLY